MLGHCVDTNKQLVDGVLRIDGSAINSAVQIIMGEGFLFP